MYELLCCRLLWDSFWCRNTHLTEPSRLLFTAVWRLFFFSFPGLEEIWASVGAFPLTSDLSVSDLNDPMVWSEPLSSGPYTDEKWRRQRVRERELSVLQCQSVPFPTDICGGFFCALFLLIYFCFYQSGSLNSGEESHGHPKMWRSLNLPVLLPLRTKARPAY